MVEIEIQEEREEPVDTSEPCEPILQKKDAEEEKKEGGERCNL
jgi:hypothetical protein